MTLKIAVGSGVLVFLVGATFWAGATYNRIDGIEKSVQELSLRIAKVGDIAIMQVRIDMQEQRIQRLESEEDGQNGSKHQ